jgi:hypothetical protein
MKASVAFDVCHEIYTAARELVDSRLSTVQLESASKFLWRPDRRPRLVEFVADFALAGDRALTESVKPRVCTCPRSIGRSVPLSVPLSTRRSASRFRVDASAERGSLRTPRRAGDSAECACQLRGGTTGALRASRLILFRIYYLGGAEYHAARRLLGTSELTWSYWTAEIRTRVGRELLHSGMFPPGRYFRQPTKK